MARQMSATARPSSSASVTTTLTVENSSQPPRESLVIQLRPRKKVTWKEGTVDNEFMNKKSSKVCCIFHKDKPFDEDGSDDDGHGPNHYPDHDDGCGPSTSGAH